MDQEGSSFSSLEALRKHWSTRANSKRRQVEEGYGKEPARANGFLRNGSAGGDVRIPNEPATPSDSPSLEVGFGQIQLRDEPISDTAQDFATDGSRGDGYSSSSEGERQAGIRAGDSRLPGAAAVPSNHPPSLTVMRPLGEFGAAVEQDNQGGSAATPRSDRGGRPPASAGAAAATFWKQHQTTQQLSAGIATLGKQVVKAVGQQEKEQAILKLYAVLCQTAWVSQPGLNEDWTASYLGLLDLGLPKFLKHIAALVLRRDKGYSDLVRNMAGAILKTLTRWMESQIRNNEQREAMAAVRNALEAILLDGAPSHRQHHAREANNRAEDSPSGYGNLLDTDALEGLLDPEAAPTTRASRRGGGPGSITETHQMFGSLMDTGSLEALVSQNRPSARSNTLLATQMLSSFGSALDTSDITGHMMEHKGALRATIWLFKSDQPDAWYAAASLIGSIAMLGSTQIDAMGGPKLVKPLMWVLRNAESQPKYAAMRALAVLSQDIACRTVMARQDKYLRAMVRVLQCNDGAARYMAVSTLNMLLAHDPSTHWVLGRSGIVASLVNVLKQPLGPEDVKADATLGLKHLTSSSQRNRDALLEARGLPYLINLVKDGNTDAQYNSARILRHMAMGGSLAGKSAAQAAIPALVHTLKVGRPRVCFACAAALAMVTEGQADACVAIEEEGGIQALVQLLIKGGGQGKKVAAEALQALAAESESLRPKIAAAGSIKPLVQMLQIGNLQQQAAAAGAVQALAYCPNSTASLASALAGHGVIEPLVQILNSAPRAMRCAAAGALCNLALRSHSIQVAIVEAGALEALVELLSEAQPDGQYAAAAALLNLCSAGQDVRAHILAANAVTPLISMLSADSWYCRIVAADLIAHLGSDGPLERQPLVAGSTLQALVALLCLQHTRGTLEEVSDDVAHLAYERSQDVIVMKGYKFARAKCAATAALGIVAVLDPDAASYVAREGPISGELGQMLSTGRRHVRAIAAAAVADLAYVSPTAREAFLHGEVSLKLVGLLKIGATRSAKSKKSNQMAQPPGTADAAAAAKALTSLVTDDPEAAKSVVSQGAIGPLMLLLEHGTREESLEAAALLACLHAASPAAQKVICQADIADKITSAAQEEEQMWTGRGATAALLQHSMSEQLGGYAITAKPSANLYILLQVPFEALVPASRSGTGDLGKSRAPEFQGRRKDRTNAAEARKRSMQQLREGGGVGSLGRTRQPAEPPLQPVSESAPLNDRPARRGEQIERNANDEEHWTPQQSEWTPNLQQQPAGKSRGDILETWTDL